MVQLNCIAPRRSMILPAVLACLMVAPACAQTQSAAEKALLAKAQSLAATGHTDMAVQTWKQALLVDAANREALAGIAKADMKLGKTEEARQYLDRLRAAGGTPAEIAEVEATPNAGSQAAQLSKASQLAQQGHPAEAMDIYRRIYGDTPPDGNSALAYYDTEAALPDRRAHAVEGLRRLAKKFPADSRYAVTLGRVLTYEQRTRAEGVEILRQYSDIPAAQNALRQAESWSERPAIAEAERPAPAEDSPEALAYRALNSGRLADAKRLFQNILNRQPGHAGALAGLGYVAMKQQDFSTAVEDFERARAAGAGGLDGVLATAHFWIKMSEAGDSLAAGDSAAAADGYRAALAMKPNSPEPLEGLAGALTQQGQNDEAIDTFRQVLKASPRRAAAWRGLFLTQSASGNVQDALATNEEMPAAVRTQLHDDIGYLSALIQDEVAAGKKSDADRLIAQVLSKPFPNGGRDLPAATQLQYAGLLMAAQKYDAAIRLYQQVVTQTPDNAGAWRALIAAQHQHNQDDAALASVGRMPQAVFDKQQSDAAFLTLIGSIYQSQHDLNRAQRYLERALALDASAPPALTLQLADIYLAQGDAQKSYSIYRAELDRNPASPPALRGAMNALHLLHRDREALRMVAALPESVRLRLDQDPSFLQTLASIQASAGQSKAALATFAQLAHVYTAQGASVPLDARIQYGWILLQTGENARLYSLIASLGSSQDLSAQQQDELARLWASWSVQQASAALRAGNGSRAVAILQAAAQTFPKNMSVYEALAGTYLKMGQPRQALAIYTALDMDNASASQYQGAIGAALAAGDMQKAEAWLQTALDQFKNDPAILKMAAQYEQARGDKKKAAAYYQAALNAMGPAPFGEGFLPASGSQPQNGVSPEQRLMQLLAPGGHAARSTESAPMEDNERVSDLSWQEAPRATVSTLGDFAEQGPAVVAESVSPDSSAFSADHTQPQTGEALQRDTLSDASRALRRSDGSPSITEDGSLGSQPAETLSTDASVAPQSDDLIVPPVLLARPTQAQTPAPIPAASSSARQPAAFTRSQDRAGSLQAAVHALVDPSSVPSLQETDHRAPRQPALPADDSLLAPSPIDAAPAQQATLPPLTHAGGAPPVHPKTEREQVEDQLAILQGASSAWFGGSSAIDYRSGQLGYDRLAAYSSQIEASGSLGSDVRVTFIVKPVILDAGQANSQATVTLGTLEDGDVPDLQTASGVGAELQFRTPAFAAGLGYTPRGFRVQNVTGDLLLHLPSSHFTFSFNRNPVTDTMLSYAGLSNPGETLYRYGTLASTFAGQIWGGVIANAGEIQYASGSDQAGWYIQGGGQYLTGRHVQYNRRMDGDAGAYWAVLHQPQYGSLVLGMNFFGMHYDHNLRYFTLGQGGYFSPAAYMLANVPVTFNGHYGPRFHYRAAGSLGLQAFQEDAAPYFPLDPTIQKLRDDPYYPQKTSAGVNYSLNTEAAYAVADHWYVGGSLTVNNSLDYTASRVNFFVRYLFRPQPALEETGPTGIFPSQGLRPLQVP